MSITREPEHREQWEDPEDRLFMHDLEELLNRRADEDTKRTMQIGHLLKQGYRPGEIQKRLQITAKQYNRALEWLEDAVAQHRKAS